MITPLQKLHDAEQTDAARLEFDRLWHAWLRRDMKPEPNPEIPWLSGDEYLAEIERLEKEGRRALNIRVEGGSYKILCVSEPDELLQRERSENVRLDAPTDSGRTDTQG